MYEASLSNARITRNKQQACEPVLPQRFGKTRKTRKFILAPHNLSLVNQFCILSIPTQEMDFLFCGKPFEHLFANEFHVKPFQDPACYAVVHPDLTGGRAHHETGGKVNSPAIAGVILAHGASQVTCM